MLRVTTVMSPAPGAPYYATFYFGGSTSGEAAAAQTAVGSFWQGLQDVIASGLQIQNNGEVELVDPATGQVTEVFQTTGVLRSGTGTGDVLPSMTQGLLRWRSNTFINGREVRGRTFIPSPTEANSTSGVPITAYRTALEAAGTTLLTGATGAGGVVVYSPTHRQAAAVTARSAWTQWAVLRSRRP